MTKYDIEWQCKFLEFIKEAANYYESKIDFKAITKEDISQYVSFVQNIIDLRDSIRLLNVYISDETERFKVKTLIQEIKTICVRADRDMAATLCHKDFFNSIKPIIRILYSMVITPSVDYFFWDKKLDIDNCDYKQFEYLLDPEKYEEKERKC